MDLGSAYSMMVKLHDFMVNWMQGRSKRRKEVKDDYMSFDMSN